MQKMTSIEEATSYILGIPKFAAKIGTDNLKVLMKKLGNPHLSMKTVHIAGTNGKGSVTELLRLMLTNAGYKTGSFVSPHLNKINERISIDGLNISDEAFLDCFNLVKEKSKELFAEGFGHPSFFEFVFAMAAVYFANQKVDYAVFETGMGGRLDATSIINPEVSVITSIGLDHMQYLGDTIEKIAFEKAGIIKNGIPVVINTGNKTADSVIFDTAAKCGSTVYPVEKSKVIINEISPFGIDFSLLSSYYKYYSLKLKTGAKYQTDNAATAVMAFNILMKDTNIDIETVIRKSIQEFFWPGRMEYIRDNIIIDGAHNEDAAKRFVEALKTFDKQQKLKLLFAVSSDKDYDSIIRIITEALVFDTIYITEINSVRGTDTKKVLTHFEKYLGKDTATKLVTMDKSEDILDLAAKNLRDEELLVCVGSLYLVAEIKAYFSKEQL